MTSIPSAWYDSSCRRNKLLAAPSCRRVIETKSGQNRMSDPGGSQGRLRTYPFLGIWRALLCDEVIRVGAAGDELQRFWRIDDSGFKNLQDETNRLRHTYSGQSFFLRYGSFKKSYRRGRLEAIGAEGTNGGNDVDGGSRL